VEMTGLLPALQELAHDSRQMFKIECSLHHDGCPLPVDPKTVLHLYRIAQEAIHNAIRHGQATHILLALRKNGSGLEFAISDNGLGLMASPNGSPKGMGLQTMQFRAQQIGGEMKIESSPGTGTTILCLLPISPATHLSDC
jgi:signal transduction histidine kinase